MKRKPETTPARVATKVAIALSSINRWQRNIDVLIETMHDLKADLEMMKGQIASAFTQTPDKSVKVRFTKLPYEGPVEGPGYDVLGDYLRMTSESFAKSKPKKRKRK